MYRTWRMQGPTMGRLQLGFDTSLDDWTIHGAWRPGEVGARIDYLQMIASEVVARVRRTS